MPWPEPPVPVADRFIGEINDKSVDEFIATHPPGSVTRIGLFSLGGDVAASIRLARWIRQNNLDVVVIRICHSGCASYAFVAGRYKTIEPKANVIWHGSMEQKDIRALQQEYESRAAKLAADPSAATAEETEYVEKFRARYLNIERQRVLQHDFFRDVGVNEEIMRLGQEPIDYGIDGWTTTVRAMKRYGIDNVKADDDYGSTRYMQRDLFVATLEEGKLLTFDVDESGRPVPSQATVEYIHLPVPKKQ